MLLVGRSNRPGRISCLSFLNAAGKVLFRAEGLAEAEQFMQYGKSAVKKAEGIVFEKISLDEGLAEARRRGEVFCLQIIMLPEQLTGG